MRCIFRVSFRAEKSRENRETSWSASALTFEKQTETRWRADFYCDDGNHLLVEVIK